MAEPRPKQWLARLKGTELARSVGERGRTLGRELGLDEIETLVRRDSVKAYSFYHANRDDRAELPDRGVKRAFALSRAVFLSFLRKLTPARRLAYMVGLGVFVWGLWQNDWWGGVVGFLLLNFLLALELAEKLVTKDELEIARAIQFSLFPVWDPRLGDLEVSSFFEPAHDVGGDYYDFAIDGSRRFTLILGDVSGKGIPAALYAMKLQALFELLGRRSLDPREMLIEMNDVISERIERNYFITAVVGVLDLRDKTLVLARAGHNHPLHYSAATGAVRWLKPNGVGIGMRRKPLFDGLLEELQVQLGANDVLVFYTDGVTEAMNAALEPYGYDRLAEVLRVNAHLPADQIKNALLRSLDVFRKDQAFGDDVTLVVTKIKS